MNKTKKVTELGEQLREVWGSRGIKVRGVRECEELLSTMDKIKDCDFRDDLEPDKKFRIASLGFRLTVQDCEFKICGRAHKIDFEVVVLASAKMDLRV